MALRATAALLGGAWREPLRAGARGQRGDARALSVRVSADGDLCARSVRSRSLAHGHQHRQGDIAGVARRPSRFQLAASGRRAEGELRADFANEEPSPVRRVEGGFLLAATDPSPVRGTVLPLSESLFTNDAVILDPVNSHAVRYAAGQGGHRALAQNVMARLSRARRLVETIRRAVPLHRALARLCQSQRLRRRIQRQAGPDAHRTRRRGAVVVPGRGRIVLRPNAPSRISSSHTSMRVRSSPSTTGPE